MAPSIFVSHKSASFRSACIRSVPSKSASSNRHRGILAARKSAWRNSASTKVASSRFALKKIDPVRSVIPKPVLTAEHSVRFAFRNVEPRNSAPSRRASYRVAPSKLALGQRASDRLHLLISQPEKLQPSKFSPDKSASVNFISRKSCNSGPRGSPDSWARRSEPMMSSADLVASMACGQIGAPFKIT